MVGNAGLEFVCHICNGPIKVETDLATDESGQSFMAAVTRNRLKPRQPSSAIFRVRKLPTRTPNAILCFVKADGARTAVCPGGNGARPLREER